MDNPSYSGLIEGFETSLIGLLKLPKTNSKCESDNFRVADTRGYENCIIKFFIFINFWIESGSIVIFILRISWNLMDKDHIDQQERVHSIQVGDTHRDSLFKIRQRLRLWEHHSPLQNLQTCFWTKKQLMPNALFLNLNQRNFSITPFCNTLLQGRTETCLCKAIMQKWFYEANLQTRFYKPYQFRSTTIMEQRNSEPPNTFGTTILWDW